MWRRLPFLFLLLPTTALPLDLIASSGAQTIATGTGLTGDLTVRTFPLQHMGLMATGRSGGVFGHHDQQLLLALLVGPTVRVPLGPVLAHAAVQLQHVHHAQTKTWRDHPGANLAGDSSGSVLHRTGVEASLGVTVPTAVRVASWTLVLEADAVAGMLPSSAPLAWVAGARLGVGLTRP